MKTVFVVALLIGAALAAPQQLSSHEPIPILKQSTDMHEDGSYQWEWESGNGIKAEARGVLKNPETQAVQGSWSWVADDGQTYTITYIADENGFQPQGAHLPTPPPVPEAILKSLEWNAAHPEPEEKLLVRAAAPSLTRSPLLVVRQ